MMDDIMIKKLSEDVLYDQRSLVYENGELREIEDPWDSNTIQEGRMGEFFRNRLKTNMGIPLFLPVTKASASLCDARVLVDTDVEFTLAAENRSLSLRKMGSAESEAAPHRDEYLIPWSGDDMGDKVRQWVGKVHTDACGTMVGIVSRISGTDGYSYLLTYAGTGNFTDVKMEQREILKALLRRTAR